MNHEVNEAGEAGTSPAWLPAKTPRTLANSSESMAHII
jgi:hypothetical protein